MIRFAERQDAAAINAIYNHYVANTVITFDIEPWSLAKREVWIQTFNHADTPYQLFVYEVDGVVVGFAYFNAFRGFVD